MDTHAQSVELPSWSHYYDFDLGWNAHLTNVVHHLPMMWAIRREKSRRIIEVGSGTGSLAIFLSYLGKRVTSVDLSPEVLARAERNNRHLRGRVTFARADAFTLEEFADQSFDLAVSQGFFEHFDDAQIHALLSQQLRVARRVLFTVPNAAYGTQDRGDERLMSKDEWEAILRAGGFSIVQSSEYRPVCRGTFTGHAWKLRPSMYLAVASR